MNGSVAILIPYFGGDSSAANSAASRRPHYFRKTVESLRPLAPQANLVVGVCTPEDKRIHPITETLRCEPRFLAAELCRWAQQCVVGADYIYVTEADQALRFKYEALDAVAKDAFLVPHRLEELWEHESGTLVGSDRGVVVRHRDRLWVLPNGNPDEWQNGTFYAPDTDKAGFGGAYLCTAEFFKSLKFTDEDEYPVEHATGFTAYRSGRALKTGMWNEFFVEHLSGIEYHHGRSVG